MKTLIVFMSFVLLLQIAGLIHETINEELALRKKEGRCIKAYISLGIERKNIVVSNGTCWIKGTRP